MQKSDNDIALFNLVTTLCQKSVKNRRNILKRFETKRGIINTKNTVITDA